MRTETNLKPKCMVTSPFGNGRV